MKKGSQYAPMTGIIIMTILITNVRYAFADDSGPATQPRADAQNIVEQAPPSVIPTYFEENANTNEVDFSGNELPENWQVGDSATLTGDGETDEEGDGWLRLTGKQGYESGYAFNNEELATANGMAFSFDFASWGGSGADGLTFFLMDGSTSPEEFMMGGNGGSLGYSPRHKVDAGLSNAVVGIGLDEFGNFAQPAEGRVGGPGRVQDSITVRGSGDGFEGYEHVATSDRFIEGIDTPKVSQRPDQDGERFRNVTIVFTPVELQFSLTLTMQFGAESEPRDVFSNLLLPGIVPATIKYGFTATSGGATNYHEIRNLVVDKKLIEEVWEIIEEEEQTGKPQPGKRNPDLIAEVPVQIVQEDDTLVIIPVTGMELQELGCGTQTQLLIEEQAYALLPSLCGYQGGLWLLADEALPDTLPQGYEVIKSVELLLVKQGQPFIQLMDAESAQFGFFAGEEDIMDNLAIFHWNPDLYNGKGGWTQLVTSVDGDRIETLVNLSGIYVLAGK